jgi:hypothetical protein
MASRSTRNKIRFQLEQVIKKLEGIQVHFKYADDLALEQHPRLNAALPPLVGTVEELKTVVSVLRDSI